MNSRLHLLAQRLPALQEIHSAQALLHTWEDQYQKYLSCCTWPCGMQISRPRQISRKQLNKRESFF